MQRRGNLDGVLEVFEAHGEGAPEVGFVHRDDFAEIQDVRYRSRRGSAAIGFSDYVMHSREGVTRHVSLGAAVLDGVENRGRFAHQVFAFEDHVEEDVCVDEQLHVLLLAVLLVEVAPVVFHTGLPLGPLLRGPRSGHAGAKKSLHERAAPWLSAARKRVEILTHEGGQVRAVASAVFLGAFDDVWIEVKVLGGFGHGLFVGVVGDTKDGGLDAEPRPVVFQPFAQAEAWAGGLVIRAASDASALVPAATRLVRGIVPQDPIENVLTIGQIKDQSVAPRRLNAVLVSSFGVLAVIIAAVGIAGVLAFSVSARTNEIGIRMSLGADSGRVQRMVLMEGGVLLALGLVLGVGGALIATRLIRGLLFGVAPHDPITLVGVAVLMAAVGIGACWLPALRASKIDPAVTMRGQ